MKTTKREKTFFKLYESEADALFRFISFRMADREKAKDIMQETYLKLWKVMCDKELDNTRAYLYRIARNLLIDEYRKTKAVSLDDLIEDGFDAQEIPAISTHEGIDIARALLVLKEMPEKYSEVLWLRLVEDWSVRDIAESLLQSENAVSVRIHRGLKFLRERLAAVADIQKKV
jgi:RNA polymerase sigma-70 factor (ECF subfamily)